MQQDLTEYLHSTHRLVLASGKTRILDIADFRDQVLDDPEEIERREIHEALQNEVVFNGYDFEAPNAVDVDNDPRRRIDALNALMERVCRLSPLDLGLARHVLRKCRRYGIRAIIPHLLEHFDHFIPVLNDVVLYLRAVLTRRTVDQNHDLLLEALNSPAVRDVVWARYWVSHLIVRTWTLLSRPEFAQFVLDHGDVENQAYAALQTHNIPWVRQQRVRIDQMGGWARRQVLRSGLALAADERRHWYRNLLANNRPGAERWLLPWLLTRGDA